METGEAHMSNGTVTRKPSIGLGSGCTMWLKQDPMRLERVSQIPPGLVARLRRLCFVFKRSSGVIYASPDRQALKTGKGKLLSLFLLKQSTCIDNEHTYSLSAASPWFLTASPASNTLDTSQ
jgi:hypothetical protein